MNARVRMIKAIAELEAAAGDLYESGFEAGKADGISKSEEQNIFKTGYEKGYVDGRRITPDKEILSTKQSEPAPWEGAPDWARYKAMDADGTWYWFEDKPCIGYELWSSETRAAEVVFQRWQESLIERPQPAQENWKPKEGEVCLFWEREVVVMRVFFGFRNNGLFVDSAGAIWSHCAKAHSTDDLKLSIDEIKARGEWL